MIGQPFVFFLIDLKEFPVICLLDTRDNVRTVTIFYVSSMNAEKALMVPDILGIDQVEIAFAERKVMNGIQQVGLS
jgi:hypothetical protein